MDVSIKFAGGPLDGQEAFTDGLDQAKIFFDEPDRRVLLYVRIDELVYAYSHITSMKLTEEYDRTFAKFNGNKVSSLRFDGTKGEDNESD